MRNQNFGIEIEMTGLTRAAAARVIADYFGTSAVHVGGTYDTYTVRDGQNRQWKVVSDASISCEARGNRSAGRLYSVELVSPICQYGDIETIQEIVRKLRSSGSKVNSSCGIHVHIDASSHTPKTLRNIVNIMASKEDLLYKALKIEVARERYCRKADTRFLDDVNNRRPATMSELESLWYNGRGGSHNHYDSSRYDIFVKDTPDSAEWICYDNPSDEVKYSNFNLEQEMFSVLNSAIERYGLSYTECNFETVNTGIKSAK